MQAKLAPYNNAKISFPGFQEILDFTSAGSESSVSVTVNGDTDKEYIIAIRCIEATENLIRLNSDAGNNYGSQYIGNNTGTLAASRGTANSSFRSWGTAGKGIRISRLLTPSGFPKTHFNQFCGYNSGTTIDYAYLQGDVWNNTANVTNISILPSSGNFTAGSRIVVYARRSQS